MRGWKKGGYVGICILIAGCNSAPEEEMDYDRIVKQDEEVEWISTPKQDNQHIAGDLFPDPQERLICESPEMPNEKPR